MVTRISASALAALLMAVPAVAGDLHADVLATQQKLFDRGLHPDTGLLYRRVDLDSEDPWRGAVFPTAADIRRRNAEIELMYHDPDRPDQVDVRNSARDGGLFLAALVAAHEATGAAVHAEQARTVFEGLARLATVAPRPGFVARSVLPEDGRTHLAASSADQYTSYLYGLWRYHASDAAPTEHRQQIRQIVQDICQAIQRDGFAITAANGIPAPEGDIAALRANRATRLLMFYRVGFHVTGDPAWRAVYEQFLQENGGTRLASMVDPRSIRHPHRPRDEQDQRVAWTDIWQNQLALTALFELEERPRLRALYLEGMRVHARLASGRKDPGLRELQVVLRAQRTAEPPMVEIDSPEIGYVRQLARRLLSQDECGVDLLLAYWTAVRLGILQTPRGTEPP